MTVVQKTQLSFILAWVALSLTACSWDQPVRRSYEQLPADRSSELSHRLETVLITARSQVGTPYRYGGSSPSGFDCSGLIRYVYGTAGITTPRTTRALWRELRGATGGLQPGDVLFFDIGGTPSHVGLYLGDGEFVHAPASGRRVSLADLSQPYYRKAFIRAGRVMQ